MDRRPPGCKKQAGVNHTLEDCLPLGRPPTLKPSTANQDSRGQVTEEEAKARDGAQQYSLGDRAWIETGGRESSSQP